MRQDRLDVFGNVSAACAMLAQKDKTLARALNAIGEPYIRCRPGGFEGLFRIIVEQQVSVASAQAIWKRCQAGVDPMAPETVLCLGEAGVRGLGLTRQKARYIVGLAEAITQGGFDPKTLAALDDQTAAHRLLALHGVGPWTAAIYLLFCEGRVDIWPPGDIALLGAYAAARKRGPKPNMARLDRNAFRWRPYRGVAAHILWTYYAHIRDRKPI